uniref:Uncharacterized protein n=1 Tax=Anguilla anguilla TaxID=7936 RepID=A0A0E9XBR1_ANGAN
MSVQVYSCIYDVKCFIFHFVCNRQCRWFD